MIRLAKATVFGALLWIASALPSFAQQSSPNWSFGYVPTPAEWNHWFAVKSDWPGSASCLLTGCTFSGPVITAASTAIGAGLNVPPGVAPTTPNNGDIWTTSAGIFVQINGATVGPLATASSPSLVPPVIITGANANALAVGLNGATNPAFNVDTSTASSATGVNVKSAAAGGGVALSAISSGTNEALSINAKGSGGINLGNVSTGNVTVTPNLIVTGASAQDFVVGPNGTTNPTLQVDDSTASAATGVLLKSAAAGAGVALSVLSSGTNENLTLNAKGSGTVNIGGVSTGAVSIGGGGGGLTVTNNFTATGLVTYADIATAAVATCTQYASVTANTLTAPASVFCPEFAATFGSTTTFNFNNGPNQSVTLTGNITTMTLSNVTQNMAGQIRFIQDGTGSRTTVWNSIFKFASGVTPSLTTATPNAIDVLFYSCVSTSLCYASLTQNMK